MHDGARIICRQRLPVVVFEARPGFGPRLLVAEAERVAELVPQDASQGEGGDRAERGQVDEDISACAAEAGEERARQVRLPARGADVKDHVGVARITGCVLGASMHELHVTRSLPGGAGGRHGLDHGAVVVAEGRADAIGQVELLRVVPLVDRAATDIDDESSVLHVLLVEFYQLSASLDRRVAVDNIDTRLRLAVDLSLEFFEARERIADLLIGCIGCVGYAA